MKLITRLMMAGILATTATVTFATDAFAVRFSYFGNGELHSNRYPEHTEHYIKNWQISYDWQETGLTDISINLETGGGETFLWGEEDRIEVGGVFDSSGGMKVDNGFDSSGGTVFRIESVFHVGHWVEGFTGVHGYYLGSERTTVELYIGADGGLLSESEYIESDRYENYLRDFDYYSDFLGEEFAREYLGGNFSSEIINSSNYINARGHNAFHYQTRLELLDWEGGPTLDGPTSVPEPTSAFAFASVVVGGALLRRRSLASSEGS